MPLDSFARARVKKICGEVNPSIGRLGSLSPKELSALSADDLATWIKESRPRRFLAAELIYAWTVDAEKWDDVPFLYAANAELRSDWLGVALVGEDGTRLTRVSPRQLETAKKFHELVMSIETLELVAEKKKTPAAKARAPAEREGSCRGVHPVRTAAFRPCPRRRPPLDGRRHKRIL